MTYNPENIFAKILAGQLPAVKVWETDRALCIMDAFPEGPGHCLILLKQSAETLFEVDASNWMELMGLVHATAHALAKAFPKAGIVLAQYNGSEAGQTVPHLHVHLIPRMASQKRAAHGKGAASTEDLEANAEKIRAHLPESLPRYRVSP